MVGLGTSVWKKYGSTERSREVPDAVAAHFRIVGTFVVVGVDDDADVVAILREDGQGAGAAEGVVIGMRREDLDGFAV